MKIVVIEPLAVEEKRFLEIARAAVGQEHEIVCYDTCTTDVKELGERGKDADIIALGNLPFPREVLEQCENLKMLAVAFTGLDHVDLAYCEERWHQSPELRRICDDCCSGADFRADAGRIPEYFTVRRSGQSRRHERRSGGI